MPGAQFFPDARVNLAENMLRRRDDASAIIFRAETGDERTLTFKELYDQVSLWQQALKDAPLIVGSTQTEYHDMKPHAILPTY